MSFIINRHTPLREDSLGTGSSKTPEEFVSPAAAGGIRDSAEAAEALYYQKYPNRWSYIRQTYLRDAASEFLGTMIMLMLVPMSHHCLLPSYSKSVESRIGVGVNLQVNLSSRCFYSSLQGFFLLDLTASSAIAPSPHGVISLS